MKQYYILNPQEVLEYRLLTDPPEAMYWSTYRLKKSNIKLTQKMDRSLAASIKQEIFDDIISTEL